MRVTRKNKNAKRVKELFSGECFLSDDKLFIVTDEFDDKGNKRCVRLATGTIYYFGQATVTPVDAEVIIHD